MATKPPATIYDILQLVPGSKDNPTWVNDEFEGVVSNIKSGQKSTSCLVSDAHNPNVSITAVFWDSRDLSRFNGCVCHFAGQGMKRDEYKGTQQVSCSAKTTVNVVGRHTGTPASQGGAQQPPKAGGGSAPAPAAGGVIHGATVGMAINQAVGAVLRAHERDQSTGMVAFITGPMFYQQVYTVASDLIRASRALEAGKLLPSAKDRADPNYAAKQKEAADKAEADRKAAEDAERKRQEEEARRTNQPAPGAAGNLDEDVPF